MRYRDEKGLDKGGESKLIQIFSHRVVSEMAKDIENLLQDKENLRQQRLEWEKNSGARFKYSAATKSGKGHLAPELLQNHSIESLFCQQSLPQMKITEKVRNFLEIDCAGLNFTYINGLSPKELDPTHRAVGLQLSVFHLRDIALGGYGEVHCVRCPSFTN